jgi:CRISPR/Cas system-associated protein Csx1
LFSKEKISKILIYSIGTGPKADTGYQLAKYKFNGKINETTFISKALCEFLDIDKLYLVGTSGSIWNSVSRKR